MRLNGLIRLICGLFLVMVVTQSGNAQLAGDGVRITEIRVDGNRRVAVGTVQSYLPVRVGDLTSRASLSNALERLYETNLFKDIKLDLDGSILIVSVVENPIINRVNIEGNDVLNDERLLEIIDVQPRRVYNRTVAIEATRKLIDIYRASGRFAAVIEPKIIELGENRVDLVFEVNEGPLIKISSIAFSGNNALVTASCAKVLPAARRAGGPFCPRLTNMMKADLIMMCGCYVNFTYRVAMPILWLTGCAEVCCLIVAGSQLAF